MVVNLAWWILQSLLIFKRSSIGYACSVKMALDFQRFHGPRLPHSLRSMKTKGKKNRSISDHHDLALGQ